jgi:thiamine-phosphate pyrophosphorylase
LLELPSLYAILDTTLAPEPVAAAEALFAGGIKLMQYRHKGEFARKHWEQCCRIAEMARQAGAIFIVNDRLDIALMAGADGVHLGQDELPLEAARRVAGAGCIIGMSTHYPAQTAAADALPVDYIAIGPVFATNTKENPDPVIGLNGVAAARRETNKPLVAIGGITRENAASVLGTGADSVAVARDLLRGNIEDFVRRVQRNA